MDAKDYLTSLEIMRDFVARVVPCEVYMKNLIIDHIETPNRRLWALRVSIQLGEREFAQTFGLGLAEYREYERHDFSVPREFLEHVARRFSIPVGWLLCECPILPMPVADRAAAYPQRSS
ncbi:helix-turn-helix transcriptional regulator [candidate division WOR-3 bacterium]|nr:helix-turn-helix transcriptional regulator [candidate division WOR-3 bacterium]